MIKIHACLKSKQVKREKQKRSFLFRNFLQVNLESIKWSERLIPSIHFLINEEKDVKSRTEWLKIKAINIKLVIFF